MAKKPEVPAHYRVKKEGTFGHSDVLFDPSINKWITVVKLALDTGFVLAGIPVAKAKTAVAEFAPGGLSCEEYTIIILSKVRNPPKIAKMMQKHFKVCSVHQESLGNDLASSLNSKEFEADAKKIISRILMGS